MKKPNDLSLFAPRLLDIYLVVHPFRLSNFDNKFLGFFFESPSRFNTLYS